MVLQDTFLMLHHAFGRPQVSLWTMTLPKGHPWWHHSTFTLHPLEWENLSFFRVYRIVGANMQIDGMMTATMMTTTTMRMMRIKGWIQSCPSVSRSFLNSSPNPVLYCRLQYCMGKNEIKSKGAFSSVCERCCSHSYLHKPREWKLLLHLLIAIRYGLWHKLTCTFLQNTPRRYFHAYGS